MRCVFQEIYHFTRQISITGGSEKYVCLTRSIVSDYASTMLPIPNEIDVTNGDIY